MVGHVLLISGFIYRLLRITPEKHCNFKAIEYIISHLEFYVLDLK